MEMSTQGSPMTFALERQGETLTFFGEPDNAASRVEFEVRIAPGAVGPEPHIHPKQSELFAVTSGRMLATVDAVEHVLGPGEELLVQPGEVHTFRNASEGEPLEFRCVVEPALNFQWMLTESAKSAIRTGGGSWKKASLLEAAYILRQIPGEYRLVGMPLVVQNLLLGALATLAVLLGKARNIEPLRARARAG